MDCGWIEIDFVTIRAHSMKRSTIGLNVRFFSVIITTGRGRAGSFMGNTFNADRSALRWTVEIGAVAT